MKQNPEINSKNIIEEITNKTKRHDYEPKYLVEFTINHCHVLIYINDMLAYKYMDGDGGSTGEEISALLLSNKDQKLKVVCLPIKQRLDYNSGIDIEIGSYDNRNRFAIEKQQDNIFAYGTPKGDKVSGKEYFEETITFNLPNVPYKIDGRRESQDLRNFDKKILEERVLQAYKMIEKAFKEKDLDKIAQFSYNKIRDQTVSQYFDKDEVQEGWDELASIAGAESLEFFPLEDYELVFYGDGKLVGLKSKKKEKGFREASALLCKYKKEGNWTGAE
ncbi:MAG: hypothetical protein EOO44_22315, partial [Flavobacterium sp.]